MNIIFAGTPTNAASTLEALVEAGFDVSGVLTRTDAEVGRKKVITESPVAAVASRLGLEITKANSISAEVQTWIESKKANIGVIVAYGSILRRPALEAPTHGWINVHYSLLPEFPGASPVQSAILDGKTMTGVTVFRLDEGIDTGPILSTRQIPIGPKVTSGELLSELTSVGSELLIQTLNELELRFANQFEQPKTIPRVVSRKLNRADARIDFSRSALVVHNLVRAMNPEPMAWFELEQLSIRVLSTELAESSKLSFGELGIENGELQIGCGSGNLRLLRVQPSGKNQMSGADWYRGLNRQSVSIS